MRNGFAVNDLEDNGIRTILLIEYEPLSHYRFLPFVLMIKLF